jgi:hypothetical protein
VTKDELNSLQHKTGRRFTSVELRKLNVSGQNIDRMMEIKIVTQNVKVRFQKFCLREGSVFPFGKDKRALKLVA